MDAGHAAFWSTVDARWIGLAGSVAVAYSVGRTRSHASVITSVAWIGSAAGHVEALAGRSGQVAALAGTGAAAFAAYAVYTLGRLALGGIRAKLPILALAADPEAHAILALQHALVAGLALNVAGTDILAHAVGAQERRAVHKLRIPARALAVARPGGIFDEARARGRSAHRVLRVECARAKSITQAGVAAGRGIRSLAGRVGLARRDEGTVAHRSSLVARYARATARDVAAHAVYTEARGTPGVGLARGAVGALAAASGHALLSNGALGVGCAVEGTVIGGRIATVGRAGLRNRVGTLAVAVAGEDAGHPVAVTGARFAFRALQVKATGALAVAGSIVATGGGRAGRTDQGIVGPHARRDEGTVTQGTGQIAGFAGLPAGCSTTDPIHAESALAFPIASTRLGFSFGLARRARRAGVWLLGRIRGSGVAFVPSGRVPAAI